MINTVHNCKAEELLNKLILNKIKVDLIYIDPPYNTGKKFDDFDDIQSFNEYLNYYYSLYPVYKDILNKSGSIYVHVDYRTVHYHKIMLDNIFGINNFRNEIIWCYRSIGRLSTNYYPNKHSNILWYTKSNNYKFNIPKVKIKEISNKRFNKIDENGKKYYIFNSKKYNVSRKLYMNETRPMYDWWDDINSLSHGEVERIKYNYSTQKPEALLERIILSTTEENDIVLDTFGGSGVTAAVAKKNKRNYITGDINPNSIKIINKRLGDII